MDMNTDIDDKFDIYEIVLWIGMTLIVLLFT